LLHAISNALPIITQKVEAPLKLAIDEFHISYFMMHDDARATSERVIGYFQDLRAKYAG
jgi:hypothetical protein